MKKSRVEVKMSLKHTKWINEKKIKKYAKKQEKLSSVRNQTSVALSDDHRRAPSPEY